MGLINRFLLFLYAAAIAFLALGAVALFLQVVPYDVLDNELRFVLSRWELLAGAAVFFILSIHFVGCSITAGTASGMSSSSGEVMVLTGENGEIKVTVDAVKRMLENIVLTVGGVSSAKVKVNYDPKMPALTGITLDIALSLYQGKNVSLVSDQVREKITTVMQHSLGVDNFVLNTLVEDMSGAAPAKKQRVV